MPFCLNCKQNSDEFIWLFKKGSSVCLQLDEKEQWSPSAQEEMVSRVLAMENFAEENYVGLKEYVMDLKVYMHLLISPRPVCHFIFKAVGGGS